MARRSDQDCCSSSLFLAFQLCTKEAKISPFLTMQAPQCLYARLHLTPQRALVAPPRLPALGSGFHAVA